MESASTRPRTILMLGLFAISGCVFPSRAVPVDPTVSFAAHMDHRGLVIDRMENGRTGILVSGCSFFCGDKPRFVVRSDDTPIAGMWLDGPTTIVRTPATEAGTPIGQVDTRWEDGAIRFRFSAADHESHHSYESGTFQHVGGVIAPAELGQPADSLLDVRGTYRAEIRDALGAPVGWMRVRISPYQAAPRTYDAVLPADISGALAMAAVARLDAEIDWVEQHARDPYVGN